MLKSHYFYIVNKPPKPKQIEGFDESQNRCVRIYGRPLPYPDQYLFEVK